MGSNEKIHLDKVASLGCVACRKFGIDDSPAEIHHIGNGTMGKRASDFETIPLCSYHHRWGGHGEAVHSGRKKWEEQFGTERDLLREVMDELYA